MFFAFILDAYSRRVVGWQLAGHMRTTLVLDALRMALHQRGPGADVKLVPHSDRGSLPRFKRLSQRGFARARVGLRVLVLMIWLCECPSREAARLVR